MKANYKGGKNFGSNPKAMLKEAKKVQKKLEEALEELSKKEYRASSGGGMVKVVVTGGMEIKEIEINPEIVDDGDISVMQDLTRAAANEALSSARTEREQTIEELSNFNLNGMLGSL